MYKTFRDLAARGTEQMTISGTVNKTFLLLLCCLFSASFTWFRVYETGTISPVWMYGATFGALGAAIWIAFDPTKAPALSLLYALLEGLALGAVSAFFEMRFPGIVLQAVALTFGTLFCLLAAYRTGAIRPTENFKLGVAAATGAVAVFYLVSFGLSFFGISVPMIHDSGLVGILFSCAVVGIAALNLVLDFDFIEQGALHGAPKYMEWYGAFGLMVTLVWLYLEILRLLAKARSRD
ncbi:Bax inhibitor-1/YccA family protein [bacterium]|nr:Bax inhibitor-1/YccA family protein [bacterium]